MTNELEKQFFDTFGIEPTLKYYCPSCNTELEKWLASEGLYYRCGNHLECDYFLDVQSEDFEECLNCLSFKLTHPQITDRILLELICIWNLYCTYTLIPTNYQNIKEYVLEQFLLIDTYNFIVDLPIVKRQVRTLFEEG